MFKKIKARLADKRVGSALNTNNSWNLKKFIAKIYFQGQTA